MKICHYSGTLPARLETPACGAPLRDGEEIHVPMRSPRVGWSVCPDCRYWAAVVAQQCAAQEAIHPHGVVNDGRYRIVVIDARSSSELRADGYAAREQSRTGIVSIGGFGPRYTGILYLGAGAVARIADIQQPWYSVLRSVSERRLLTAAEAALPVARYCDWYEENYGCAGGRIFLPDGEELHIAGSGIWPAAEARVRARAANEAALKNFSDPKW